MIPCGRRGFVEQNVTAAVHLQVDEARREPRSVGQRNDRHRCRQLAARFHLRHVGALDDDGAVAQPVDAVEDVARRRWRVCVIRSSRAGDFAEVPGPVDIDIEMLRQSHGHRIEALDQADGVGLGLIRRSAGSRVAPVRPCSAMNSAVPMRRSSPASWRMPGAAASVGMNIRIG